MMVGLQTTQNYSFSIEGYKGNEDYILELLNNNYDEIKDKRYIDWRYLGEQTEIFPSVFFVKAGDQTNIGMSALIFRSYYVENKKYLFVVSGDTIIDKKSRGLGIAKELFKFKTQYIDEKSIPCVLGIGTDAVIKILSSIGWHTDEKLVSYSYLITYSGKIYRHLKNRLLSKIIDRILTSYNKIKLNAINTKGYAYREVKKFDQDFDYLWEKIDKTGLIIRDRSMSVLDWRYARHPDISFTIVKIFKDNNFIGYIIYNISNENVIIYDFLFQKESYFKCGFTVFIKKIWTSSIVSLRIEMISEGHPYIGCLKDLGFVNRGEVGVIQHYCPDKDLSLDKKKWIITPGDKDI